MRCCEAINPMNRVTTSKNLTGCVNVFSRAGFFERVLAPRPPVSIAGRRDSIDCPASRRCQKTSLPIVARFAASATQDSHGPVRPGSGRVGVCCGWHQIHAGDSVGDLVAGEDWPFVWHPQRARPAEPRRFSRSPGSDSGVKAASCVASVSANRAIALRSSNSRAGENVSASSVSRSTCQLCGSQQADRSYRGDSPACARPDCADWRRPCTAQRVADCKGAASDTSTGAPSGAGAVAAGGWPAGPLFWSNSAVARPHPMAGFFTMRGPSAVNWRTRFGGWWSPTSTLERTAALDLNSRV